MEYSEGSPAANNETIVNIDVNSELLEGYMEICVSYRCVECSYTSTDQKTFYEHCLGHLLKDNSACQTLIYLCSTCLKAFNSLEKTKQHLKEVHNKEGGDAVVEEPVNSLAIAVEKVDEAAEGKKKGRQKRREKLKLPCPRKNCSASFQRDVDLDIHGQCHIDAKLFCCPHCSKLFHEWPNCAVHLDKAHDVDCGLLKCAVCQVYKTWAPIKLENHMRIHSDLKAFSCKTCGQAFKQASQLRKHNLVHANDESLPSLHKSKQCTMCFKMYSDAKALKKHKDEVHSRLRPFVCHVCGHAAARKSMLTRHQRQHTGHKPLSCNICSYKTADHNSLRRHLMIHKGIRPYQCPASGCAFSTIRSGNLIRHVKGIHPGAGYTYSCKWCTYKTVSNDCYVQHVSDHLTGLIKNPSGIERIEKSVEELGEDFAAWAQPAEGPVESPKRKAQLNTTSARDES